MSAASLAWILSIAFLVCLGIGFLIGFWRGLKKTITSFILYMIGAIASFFITPLITNAVMGIHVSIAGVSGKLSDVIVNLLKQNHDIGLMIERNPNLEVFLQGLPYAIGNAIIFILLTTSMVTVIYGIYKLITMIFFRKKPQGVLNRTAGGLLGIVKTFVLLVFVFMPFAALIGVCDEITTAQNYYTEGQARPETSIKYGIIGDRLPERAVNVVKGFEGCVLTKICGIFGMDNALLDYYANVEVANQKVYIRQEVSNYYKAVDFAYQITSGEEVIYKNLDYNKISNIIDGVENGGMFQKVFAPLFREVIVDYNDYDIISGSSLVTEYSDVIDSVKATVEGLSDEEMCDYLASDIDNIYKAFNSLGQHGVIDDYNDLTDKSIKNIVQVCVSNENIDYFNEAIRKAFNVHLLQGAIVPTANKVIERTCSEKLDYIGVDTSSWGETEWNATADKIVAATSDFSVALNEIDYDVINDITILFDSTDDTDIDLALSKVGSGIDNLRATNLLKTSSNKPIIDKFLTQNKLILPSSPVEKIDGTMTTLSNYKKMFEFLSPSLTKLKQENIYNVIKNSSNAKQIIKSLAEKIMPETKKNLLSEILLPLYQVELTKEKIFDEKLSIISTELIDFSLLENYQDWKNDLKYISQAIRNLNQINMTIGGVNKTYLEVLLDGNQEAVLDDVTEANVEKVLKPILYAKSTKLAKKELINSVKAVLDEITSPASSTINIEAVTLTEGAAEDQTQEICNVFKKFISIKQSYSSGDSINDIDSEKLGLLLDVMQKNAYRTVLSSKTEEGLFKGAFINLVNTFKLENPTAVTYIESQKGVGYMSQANYPYIDFIEIMQMI